MLSILFYSISGSSILFFTRCSVFYSSSRLLYSVLFKVISIMFYPRYSLFFSSSRYTTLFYPIFSYLSQVFSICSVPGLLKYFLSQVSSIMFYPRYLIGCLQGILNYVLSKVLSIFSLQVFSTVINLIDSPLYSIPGVLSYFMSQVLTTTYLYKNILSKLFSTICMFKVSSFGVFS